MPPIYGGTHMHTPDPTNARNPGTTDNGATAPHPLTSFNPTQAQRTQLLEHLCDGYRSLHQIANEHNTTLDALVLWMSTPAIQQELTTIHSAAATHARLAATMHLPRLVPILMLTAEAYESEESRVPMTDSLQSMHARARQRDAARKATTLLLRIAKFNLSSSHTTHRATGQRAMTCPERGATACPEGQAVAPSLARDSGRCAEDHAPTGRGGEGSESTHTQTPANPTPPKPTAATSAPNPKRNGHHAPTYKGAPRITPTP